MAVHFYTLYSFQKALSDEEFLEKANEEFNSDFESRQSTSAQHFFSNMMGPEAQRRQCQEVLTKQMAAPQQVVTFVPAPMPSPIEEIREERSPRLNINTSFDYSINEPLI